MKRDRARAEKKTPGTVLGELLRAEANTLTDIEREQLGAAFLKLYDELESGGGSERNRL